ncbi:AlkA N-terminal domain-containing protein [Microcella sp.]|uniref:AlkA N-terminal domain-containing protein n=1 Tax=Microcella sp. TaxID=1913979 RepID=UPI00256A5AC1|nr:AlkA N-terminal domain-containing protein [Microcella sp.]MBX9470607.1 helix-turn-helix domain-containing protein [Microcella sp.]
MGLDHDRCYRALSARDARFDGQFIAGVHSTGIYCRPSCPAATPRPHNVRFYPTAAAAHEAGLRACKRCQPDALPGNPDWNLRDDLAGRAMRLILDGVVEREGVAGLASQLGYSSRHLARVLADELGAGPLALARAHRAESARALLAATDLPVSHVAFAAGFASIRQFNDTMREVYDLTPSELRTLARRSRQGRRTGPSIEGTTVSVRLAARPPFDGEGVLRYFADHAITGVERINLDEGSIERLLPLPGGEAFVRVVLDRSRPGVRVSARLATLSDLQPLTARVRRWFDLDADSPAIDEQLREHALLAPLVHAAPGIRIPGSVDASETLLRTMVGQQISLAAARTVLGRLAAELDAASRAVRPPEGLTSFPSPAVVAEHGLSVLRGPRTRVLAIHRAASALASGELRLDVGLTSGELRSRLVDLDGVGPWTADYVTMRVLGSPDLLLSTDLVLLRTLRARRAAQSAREAARLGEQWAPWRSYATLHLWRAAPPALSSRARPSATESPLLPARHR